MDVTFPNHKNKHTGESLTCPNKYLEYLKSHGQLPEHRPPTGIIMSYSNRLMRHVLENHKVTKVRGIGMDQYLIDETDGEVAIVGRFGAGAPVAVTRLEESIAFGADRFVSIGLAGSLRKDIGIGDVVLCDRAIRDEGVSHHYVPSAKFAYASGAMTDKLSYRLTECGVSFTTGASWTIDAPYRETIDETRRYQREGICTVEMEAAALFAVAEYRGVEMGAMFIISDSLAELEWNPAFYAPETQEGLDLLYRVSINALNQ